MPQVHVKMLEGRSDDQKRRVVKAITEAMVEICKAKPEGTTVTVEEYPRSHWAVGLRASFSKAMTRRMCMTIWRSWMDR